MNSTDRDDSTAPVFVALLIDRFLGGTGAMTAEEVGVYVLLLLHQATHGWVPNDVRRLAVIGRVDVSSFEGMWRGALRPKFEQDPDDPGKLRNQRMAHERARALASSEEARRRGRKGAEARWRKQCSSHSPSNARDVATQTQTHTHTQTHTQTKTQEPPLTPPAGGARCRAWEAPLEELRLPLDLHARLDRLAEEWASYRREVGFKPYKARTWKSQFTAAAKDPDAWEAAIQNSIDNGYQGIIPPRRAGKPPRRDTLTELGDELRRRGLAR